MGNELEIIVKTTDACNARCAYCSARSGPAGRRKLPLDIARVLCEQVRQLLDAGRCDRVRLLWHGGEPLLMGKAFFRELVSLFSLHNVTHRIQTNLTLLDREWMDILEPLVGKTGLGTSLDPFDDTRQLAGDDDGYNDRWLRAVELLDERSWRLGCVYVLHRRGLKRAGDLYWLFRNLRDNATLSLRVNPLLTVGRAGEERCEELALAPGEYGDFLIELARIWLADQRRLILSPVRDIVGAWRGGRVRSCDLAGRSGCMNAHLGIDPAGNVYNCGRAVDADGIRIGHLNDLSLADCLDHPARRPLLDREDTLLDGHCRQCEYWRFCHGGCPYESHADSETAHRPTALCEDYRRFFRWLEAEVGPPMSPGNKRQGRTRPVRDTRAALRPTTALSWNTGVRWADRIDAGQLHIRINSADDIAAAQALASRGRPVTLQLPTSLYEAYLEIANTSRALMADRIVADQLPDAVDKRLLKQLADGNVPVWVSPTVPGGGVDAIKAITSYGVPTVIDNPRDWLIDDVERLADFFLRDPALTVPIEPFYSALVRLSHDPGSIVSVPVLYREDSSRHRYVTEAGRVAVSPVHAAAGREIGHILKPGEWRLPLSPRRSIDSACATCEVFKHCRGFWIEPIPNHRQCKNWRTIVARLVRVRLACRGV